MLAIAPRPLRVAVLADHPLVTDAVRVALAGHGLETSARSWGTRHPAAPATADALLALCDLADPGLWLSPRLAGVVDAEVPALVVTPAPRSIVWGAVLALGAGAVLPDSATTDEVVLALRALASGRSPMSPRERSELLRWWQEEGPGPDVLPRLQSLSPREAAVLRLLSAGLDVRAVAAELGLGRGTVRTYIAALRRKLGVRSQSAAVSTIGWLPGPHVPAQRRPTGGARGGHAPTQRDGPGASRRPLLITPLGSVMGQVPPEGQVP
jgi:DNA-binding NarL/FixJ family response regulator